jgi:hypothetical protein
MRPEPEPYLTPKNIASRGGPAVGGGLSMLGALLAMIGFLLPWASCAGTPLNGLELAQETGPAGQSLGLLYLVPFLAIGCFGIALSVIPLSAWRRIPALVGWLGLALVGVLGVVAIIPLVLLYTSYTAAQEELESSLGIFASLAGDAIKIESGYWVTAVGLGLVVLGAIFGCVVGMVGAVIPKRRNN